MPQPYSAAGCTYIASCGRSVCCIIDIFILRVVEEKHAALPIFFHRTQWKNSLLHYRYFFYTANSGREVSCIIDIFTQKKWRRCELHCRKCFRCMQWKNSELRYRYLYTASSGEEESYMHVKNTIVRHFYLSQKTSRIAAHGSRFSGTENCCLPVASQPAIDFPHRHCHKIPLPLV